MPIKIDVAPLLNSVGRSVKIDEVEEASYPEDNLVMTAPVHVTGKFTNVGETILFSGRVVTAVRLNCARCLRDFDLPVDFELEEEYSIRPPRPPVGSKELKLTDRDFVFAVEPDRTIDLSEVIRQNILTELPIQPLCDEKCSGPEKPG